ncbi:MAG: ABC transporter permease subunit [Clostridia bacterium]|nr:ABC transporter permease subunit [Clostridia bacterium]
MKKIKPALIGKIAIFIILFIIIVLPIVRMLFYIDKKAIVSVFTSSNFGWAVLNSLTSTLVATIISLVVAYALAWSINRTSIKLKAVFAVVLVFPMLIPSISHGMGLIILFGNNGIITNLFHADSSVYGFGGVVLGSVLYSFPVAFLMISDVLKYEDSSPYEAASVLGISKPRQFMAITLPYLKKPLISVIFATFTMILTDYGVPLSVGGKFKTLPVMLYEEAAGQLNYSTGSVIGLILLLPAIAAFLFDLFNKNKGNSSFVLKPFEEQKNKIKDAAAYVICGLVTLFTLLVIVSFCVQAFAKQYPRDMSFTFDNFAKTFKKDGGEFLLNSLLIALLTAVVGTVFAFVTAYLTARMNTKATKFLHLIAITSLAVPGLVLGLAYVIVFKKSFFYGTLIILIMVNTVHFFASPYLMIYNAFGKLNENLEDVGHILGVRRWRIIKDVIIPQSKYTIIEMLSYFFVNSMMTISAVSFLATSDNKPLSLLINQFETYNMMECAAVVALLIFIVNICIKAIAGLIKKFGDKKRAK